VLINLGTNARDAMNGTGPLTLAAALETVGGAAPAPGSPLLKPGAYIRLSVGDAGAGMDAATLAHATEPFFTTKATGQGTGLGLAMARGFAEQSGGALDIESAPGQGTIVRLWLPAAGTEPVPATDTPPEPAAAADSRTRLLLVDDEEFVRQVLAEQMEAAGFAVLTAQSGPDALALLDKGEAIDLLVSDLSMPGMDGLALIGEAQRRRPRLPAILLTGYATNAAEIAVSGALSGAFSLLRKPVEGRHLADRVAVMLESASLRE
jgi:CheY-like chemotaxis protein